MEASNLLPKKAAYIIFSGIGFMFMFCCLAEHDLAVSGNILWTGGYTLKIMLFSLIGGVLLGMALSKALYWHLGKKKQEAGRIRDAKNAGPATRFGRLADKVFRKMDALSRKEIFALSFLLIVLAWFPSYLAYYPGICSYDAPIQIGQIMDGIFIDHHPIAHTLLIKGALILGDRVFQNVNTGIATYTLLQMFFLGGVFAYGVSSLKKHKVSMGWVLLVQAFCMFYPFHLYMSITMTKDVVFTGFFILQALSLFEWINLGNPKAGTKILFLISTIGMILFRNNGIYAFMVLFLFLLLVMVFDRGYRRNWARLFPFGLAGLLTGFLALNMIFDLTNAQQGDRREMLSMPIQQLARVMRYHGGINVLPEDDNTLDDVEKELIDSFILNEAYREYDAHISDPVKRHTNTYVPRYRTKDFVTVYLGLFKRYPGDYLNAALEVNAGYLYPADVSHAYINVTEGIRGKGYVQTCWSETALNECGIYKSTRWKALFEQMEKWADGNLYLKLFFLKYFFVPGVWLWLYLFLFGFLAVQKKFRLCLPLILVFGYYGTLFLGPAVQLRYLYPVMALFPFLALSCYKAALRP